MTDNSKTFFQGIVALFVIIGLGAIAIVNGISSFYARNSREHCIVSCVDMRRACVQTKVEPPVCITQELQCFSACPVNDDD